MIDKITMDRINLLHPKHVPEVKDLYVNKIVPALTGRAICRFAYTLRSFSEQADMFAQGRTKLFDAKGNRLGIVTKAKPGQSYHNFGLGIDIVLIKDTNADGRPDAASWETNVDFDKDGKADWMEVVDIFKKAGWAWGGDFKSIKDAPHFEKTFGLHWKELLKRYNNKQFIPGTNYVII